MAIAKTYRYLLSRFLGEHFYQKPIIDSITSQSRRFRTFIDIGAHVGIITIAVARNFEQCIAIEPSPQNIEQLYASVRSNRLTNCHIVASALGDRTGTATLYHSRSNTADNSLVRRDDLGNGISVQLTTLDKVLEETAAPEPFFIKIDVQGYEPLVFRGADRTLTRECIIISELWPWGNKSTGCEAKEYLDLMKSCGYTACDLRERAISERKLDRFCELGRQDRFVVMDVLFRKLHQTQK